jgi:hypothetical protein
MTKIGTYSERGITVEVDEDVISGRPVLGQHHQMIYLSPTKHFVRLLLDNEHLFTQTMRDSLVKEAQAMDAVSAKEQPKRTPKQDD